MIRFAFFMSCSIVHLVSIETAATDSTAPTHSGKVSNTVENDTENGKLVELIKKNLRTNNDDYNDLVPKADSKKIANVISPEKTRRKSAWKEFDQLDAIKKSTEEEGDFILHSEEKLGHDPNAVNNYATKANKMYIANTRYPIKTKNDEAIFRNNVKKSVQAPKLNSDQSKDKIEGAPSSKNNSADGTVKRFEAKGDKRSNAMVLEAYLMRKQLEESLKKVHDDFVTQESTEDTSASLHETRGVNALDMAPARGSYLSKLRLRGRVCDRNVLRVEGPKYNSKGKPYLKAYRSDGIPFGRTRRPSQVLPRCCNCCKKSVLGCE